MSTPKVTRVSQIPGGISAFRAAVADVQQITDKASLNYACIYSKVCMCSKLLITMCPSVADYS